MKYIIAEGFRVEKEEYECESAEWVREREEWTDDNRTDAFRSFPFSLSPFAVDYFAFVTLHPWPTLASSLFLFYSSFFISFLSGFFKGTSADQDRRFSDKELKLLKTIKFPPQFDTKVILPIYFYSHL